MISFFMNNEYSKQAYIKKKTKSISADDDEDLISIRNCELIKISLNTASLTTLNMEEFRGIVHLSSP